jgi:hypothetical protein
LQTGLLRFVTASVFLGWLALGNGSRLQSADLLSSEDTHMVDRHAYNVSAVMFLLVVLSVVAASFAVEHLYIMIQVFYTEAAAGLISMQAAVLSLLVTDLLLYVTSSIALSVVVFAMLRLQGSAAMYLWLMSLCISCAYLLAAVCAVWGQPSLLHAWAAFATSSALSLVFSGYLKHIGSVGGVWYVLSSISFTRYAFQGLSVVAFSRAPDRENYLGLYAFDNMSAGSCSGYLVLWVVLLLALLMLGLHVNVSAAQRNLTGRFKLAWSVGSNRKGKTSKNILGK